MNLIELEFATAPEQTTDLEERLFALGALSVVLVDAGDQPLFEPPPGSHPLWQQIRLKALFDGALNAELAWAALRTEATVVDAHARFTAIDDQDWVRAGLAGLGPIDCGHGLWIVPSWEQLPEGTDSVCVHLDPGLAFGTGAHPTTAMCLHALAAAPPAGQQVLDYGCGSGILAIAALRLGAHHAVAVDIDPQALQATAANAKHNAIADSRLEICPPEALDATGCDLVLANILAGPLVQLAPELSARIRPGGRILLAGLLERQAEQVSAAYHDAFVVQVAAMREGWVLLEGRRRDAP